MKIGEVIRKYRKEKQMTQEEMANRLGVTTPAVNKWENGASLPDISMLAPIARLLGISVDTLLSFREDLTEDESGAILNELWALLNAGDFECAYEYAKHKVTEYPACYGLMLWMAQALDAYFVVMPQHQTAETDVFVHTCYERALGSPEEAIRIGAADAFTKSPLYVHMQFNAMESGVEDRLRDKLKETFREDERFDFVREHPQWKEVIG